MNQDTKIAYLGPAGTFTEQALRSQPDLATAELIAYPKFVDVLKATATGDCDLGFVAIENAIEGTVNITMDALSFDHELLIQREVDLDIELNLMVPPGLNKSDIEVVLSHPVAIAQCRKFLDTELPNATTRPANSTSAAAQRALEQPNTAALANELAAELHGLEILNANIADHQLNKTRFVLVAPTGIPPQTDNDKTMVVVSQQEDKPGSLIAILQEFAARKINLTRLASRPIKTEAMGNYCFIMEFEGHIADDVVGDCLKSIKAKHADIKFLGSYPSSDQAQKQNPDSSAMAQAQDWLASILAGDDRRP